VTPNAVPRTTLQKIHGAPRGPREIHGPPRGLQEIHDSDVALPPAKKLAVMLDDSDVALPSALPLAPGVKKVGAPRAS
jgi:hypothetical protein